MKVVTLHNEIEHGKRVIPSNTPLIVEDVTAGEMLIRSTGDVVSMRAPLQRKVAQSVCIVRPGGFGDILFLTPSLEALRQQYPGIRIALCTFPGFGDVLKGNPNIDEIIDYPAARGDLLRYKQVVYLENLIEYGPDAKTTHAVDVFAKAIGVTLKGEKHCRYYLSDDEREEALRRFPKTSRRRIGIQVKASQNCRTYPARKMQEVINLLLKRGDDVYLFGAPGSVKIDRHPQVVNLADPDAEPMTMRKSIAVLSTCQGFIAPDSALCHVAGALKVPTIGLFGAFPWQLRAAYHPSVYGINGHCDMSPCFYHERAAQQWPKNGPCSISGECDALANIQPERIVSKLNQIVK